MAKKAKRKKVAKTKAPKKVAAKKAAAKKAAAKKAAAKKAAAKKAAKKKVARTAKAAKPAARRYCYNMTADPAWIIRCEYGPDGRCNQNCVRIPTSQMPLGARRRRSTI